MSTASDPSTATGDLPTDAFRKHGHELIDTMWKPSPSATKLGKWWSTGYGRRWGSRRRGSAPRT